MRKLSRSMFAGVLALSAVGCTTSGKRESVKPFQQVYEAGQVQRTTRQEQAGKHLSFTVTGIPLGELCQWLAAEYGLSVVIQSGAETTPVTVTVEDVELSTVLELVARSVNLHLSKSGGAFFVGNLRPEDAGVLVMRARRLSQTELGQVLQAMGGGGQNSRFVATDGLVVVVDQVQVLRRVSEMLAEIEQTESVTWAVQLFVVTMSESAVKELGLDVEPSVNLAAAFAAVSGNAAVAAGEALSAAGSLQASLRAVATNERGKMLADPLLLLVDGQPGLVERVRRYPVRVATIQTGGGSTVQQAAIQEITAGLLCNVTCRELDPVNARLTVKLSASDFEGMAEGLPIVREDRIDVTSDVVSGGVYLVASVEREDDRRSLSTWLKPGERRSTAFGVLQVWASVVRIGGPPRATPAGGGVPSGEEPPRAERLKENAGK